MTTSRMVSGGEVAGPKEEEEVLMLNVGLTDEDDEEAEAEK